MTTDAREILSALIDREPVNPKVLADVLEDAESRALLVDFVRLRDVVARDDEERTPAWKPALVSRRRSGTWWRVAAAVVLLAGGAGGGFWLGERAGGESPPVPTRVLEFKPGVDWQPAR